MFIGSWLTAKNAVPIVLRHRLSPALPNMYILLNCIIPFFFIKQFLKRFHRLITVLILDSKYDRFRRIFLQEFCTVPQQTVDFIKGENVNFLAGGRHDPCIVHRARVVIDSITAVVLCDILSERFGTDWLVG